MGIPDQPKAQLTTKAPRHQVTTKPQSTPAVVYPSCLGAWLNLPAHDYLRVAVPSRVICHSRAWLPREESRIHRGSHCTESVRS